MKVSMLHSRAVKNAGKGHKKYLQVKGNGSVMQIIFIESDLYGNRKIVSTVYLGPTGDTRYE